MRALLSRFGLRYPRRIDIYATALSGVAVLLVARTLFLLFVSKRGVVSTRRASIRAFFVLDTLVHRKVSSFFHILDIWETIDSCAGKAFGPLHASFELSQVQHLETHLRHTLSNSTRNSAYSIAVRWGQVSGGFSGDVQRPTTVSIENSTLGV